MYSTASTFVHIITNLQSKLAIVLVPLCRVAVKLTKRRVHAYGLHRFANFVFDKDPGHMSATMHAGLGDTNYQVHAGDFE